MHNKMAFDRSVRSKDQDGRMHVKLTAISKATVNPYYGHEIPNANELGLDPNRIYMMFRDPDELVKAAPTFNNIPLLIDHIPVTAANPEKEYVVGSTGTDATFDGTYLLNSLVIWDAEAIAGVESKEQCELSCAYHYRADMTPGEYEGEHYDGVMRDIRGNHVALVEVGRAGPDVYVFDSLPTEYRSMKQSRLAVAVRAVIAAHIVPKLAQDAKLGDLTPIIGKVTKKTLAADKARIVKEAAARVKGKLAQDIELDPAELGQLIDAAAETVAEDEDDEDDKQRDGESDDDYAKRMAAKKAGTAQDDDPVDPQDQPNNSGGAMDAATVNRKIAEAVNNTVAKMQAIRVAEDEVAPFVGKIAAMDSAEAVYKYALDKAGVNLDGVHPSAYRALVGMLPKPGETGRTRETIAQDSAAEAEFDTMFPTAGKTFRA